MAANFEDIWKSLVKMNSCIGLFSFKENTIKTRKQRFYKWFSKLSFFAIFVMLINTVLMHRNDLMNFIIITSVLFTGIIVGFHMFSIHRNQDSYMEVLDWCRNIYILDQYHLLVKAKALNDLTKTQKFCNRLINVIHMVCVGDILLTTIGVAAISILFPDKIFPKYQPPVPIYLPCFEDKNLINYIINFIDQSCGAIITAQSYAYLLNIFLTISIHLLKYLDLINTTIIQMKEVFSRNYEDLGTFNVEYEIKQWTKMVCDMMSDFKLIHSKFADLIKHICFLWELDTFAAIFLFGFVVLLERQNYILTSGGLIGGLFFVAICFVNEKINEKVFKTTVQENRLYAQKNLLDTRKLSIELIIDAIYDIPWYELKPKDRRMILLLMNINEVNFTASDFHPITFQRLTTVYNAAQSNCLVLKNLAVDNF